MISSSRAATTPSRPYSFTARLKLTRGADFEAVFKNGRRSADSLFTVLYLPTALDHPRLGMTASAKRIRTAVARNRIRRVIRESFRKVARDFGGVDIVIIVKESARDAARPAMFESLAAHWQRLARHQRGPAPQAH